MMRRSMCLLFRALVAVSVACHLCKFRFHAASSDLRNFVCSTRSIRPRFTTPGVPLKAGGFASGGMASVLRTKKLPAYVDINLTKNKTRVALLRRRSQDVAFPLAKRDLRYLEALEAKFDNAVHMVGLAGPQIGIDRQMIIFKVMRSKELEDAKAHITMEMDRTVWLNPSYEPLTEETEDDYEGCFSVSGTNMLGKVARPTRIAYKATLPDGSHVEGEATHFLARVIMHEIDHLNGVLFFDKADPGTTFDHTSTRKADLQAKRIYQDFFEDKP
eukprot:TRINITY_DN48172_c0_g1_i1.p1 TRINITY_DN48172_c0_g1~~TRINITY_DN48172_c0_g1_i1.p1  ORF type:complete len:273 (-),score=26.02 TRINITY_DN48172_c0_g1_i1:7-825(-)